VKVVGVVAMEVTEEAMEVTEEDMAATEDMAAMEVMAVKAVAGADKNWIQSVKQTNMPANGTSLLSDQKEIKLIT
jgi:hypothetical protein